jgi:hypothetical protein
MAAVEGLHALATAWIPEGTDPQCGPARVCEHHNQWSWTWDAAFSRGDEASVRDSPGGIEGILDIIRLRYKSPWIETADLLSNGSDSTIEESFVLVCSRESSIPRP